MRDTLTPNGDILIDQLKTSELAVQGLQAASLVVSSPHPLVALREISQNYPSVVATLTKSRKDEQVRINATETQRFVGRYDWLVGCVCMRVSLLHSFVVTTFLCLMVEFFVQKQSIHTRAYYYYSIIVLLL